jgi:exodeoxyribonuclease III
MKIVTFNINNINKRLEKLIAWLRTAKPDVVPSRNHRNR